ncbi:hypothetical protein PU560_07635 [Georgenia sp. 10Sc9-8]|uniref:Protein kinase domain-containing protein n=1 Tax=Georgenia halotolerans TaxID=3028317 RepID=A0ABT5TXC5_9MICO|nr:hypothetical protein [Georgenia halotolerans]
MGEDEPQLPGYEVGAVARHGAHGPVWTATTRRGERVLLHAVPLPDGPRRDAALRGLDSLCGQEHPGLARLLGVVTTDDGRCVLVSQDVPGQSLADVLAAGRLTTAEVAAVRQGVGSALVHLHRAGVVHGNLNPDTVRLTPEGSVVVVDVAGEVPGQGAAGFVPPECEAGGAASPAGDVWGLGRLLQWSGGEEVVGPDLATMLSPDPRGRPAAAETVGRGAAAAVPVLAAADPARRSSGPGRTTGHSRARRGGRHRARPRRARWVGAVTAVLAVAATAGVLAVVQTGGGPGSPAERHELDAVVAGLLARRDAALAEHDQDRLAELTVPGTDVAERDRRLLAELRSSGAVPRGLSTRLVDVEVLQRAAGSAVVEAVIVQEAYRWDGDGGTGRSVAPRPPRCVRLGLVGPDPWRLRAAGPCEVSG